MEVASLVRHSFPKHLGGCDYHYEWEGERHLSVRIFADQVREIAPWFKGEGWPEQIEVDGVPLRYLPGSEWYDSNFILDAAFYKRVDGLHWFSFIYWRVRRELRRFTKTR